MALQMTVGVLVFGADLGRADWLAAFVTLVLALIALNSWGILSAAFLLIFKRADPLNWLIDLTTFVFCGVYFPITLLPFGLRLFSYLLPLTYALEAMRGAMLVGRSLGELGLPLIALVAAPLQYGDFLIGRRGTKLATYGWHGSRSFFSSGLVQRGCLMAAGAAEPG